MENEKKKRNRGCVRRSGGNAVLHLLVSFIDMFCDGWEVCTELAEGFHNRRSVWRVL